MDTKTRYTMVNKRGEEIYHSDSFWGFVGSTILTGLLSVIALAIIGGIFCTIGSLFN